jgi:hypothetical protein
MSNIQWVSKNLASKNQHLSMLLGQERATYDRDRELWNQERLSMLRTIHMLQYQISDLSSRLLGHNPNHVQPLPLHQGKTRFHESLS